MEVRSWYCRVEGIGLAFAPIEHNIGDMLKLVSYRLLNAALIVGCGVLGIAIGFAFTVWNNGGLAQTIIR